MDRPATVSQVKVRGFGQAVKSALRSLAILRASTIVRITARCSQRPSCLVSNYASTAFYLASFLASFRAFLRFLNIWITRTMTKTTTNIRAIWPLRFEERRLLDARIVRCYQNYNQEYLAKVCFLALSATSSVTEP